MTIETPVTVCLSLEGRFSAGTFPEWICHRAGLLDLSGWVKVQGPHQIDILIQGNETLVDAMELACSLGPSDILVDQIRQIPGHWPTTIAGFCQV